MLKLNGVVRLLTVLFFALSFGITSHAAENSPDLVNAMLGRFIDAGKLHPNIYKQIKETGAAEAIVVVDSSDADNYASLMRTANKLFSDTDEVTKGKAKLHKKMKEEVLSSLSTVDYTEQKKFENLPILHLKVNLKSLNSLLQHKNVLQVAENQHFSRKLVDSLPFIGVLDTPTTGVSGKGTSVAILDTGIDYTIPEFGGCSTPGTPTSCKVIFAKNFGSNGVDSSSDHGTNIASIVLGVAPESRLLALNVFSSDGYAYESDVLAAMDWVLSNRNIYNIAAVNMSFGAGIYVAPCPDLPVARVIGDLKKAGIATVTSSGNNGFKNALSYPACSPSAISVGAVYDKNEASSRFWPEANCTDASPVADQVPCFSNSAPFLTILAPGAPKVVAGNVLLAGTSQASAHVTGAIAALKGKNLQLSVDQMTNVITSSGISVTDSSNGISKPRLSVSAALDALPNPIGAAQTQDSTGNSIPSAVPAAVTTNGSGGQSASPAALPVVTVEANKWNTVAGPGWFMANAHAVSHDEAKAFQNASRKSVSSETKFSTMSPTTATPEINELARALMYDPKLIYDYVHNYIDYVPYYGALKGATLTYLDGSGNDSDQASLMIALLRASGYTAQYVYGTMTIPGAQLSNWGGVDQNSTTIQNLWAGGGVPISAVQSDGTATIDRVWVQVTVNGNNYLFDPAFKTYSYTDKINLAAAMGYNRSNFISAAANGATVGPNYVQNVNENNIKSTLISYSNNLVSTMRNQYPNNSIEDIISGRSIVATTTAQYSTTLPFQATAEWTFSDMGSGIASLRVQHAGIDYTVNTTDLSGRRLTLTYAGSDHHPELRLDGTLVASGTATNLGNLYDCVISIDHPYAANGGTYQDQSVTYSPKSGSNYAIVYNFGGVSDSLLQKIQQQILSYKNQGLADTTESVLGSTLHLMGMTWLKEVAISTKLMAAISDVVQIRHHDVGMMAQESGYYIDVKAGYSSLISKHGNNTDPITAFKAILLVGSALEHGVLEQLMGSSNPGVSTVKLFQIANSTNSKIYSVNSSNFSTIKVLLQSLPSAQQYTSSDWADFQNAVNNGNTLILPDNGQLILNHWKGKGYITKYFSDNHSYIGMIIGGNNFGGYASISEPIYTPTVTTNSGTAQQSMSTPSTVDLNISTVATSTSVDPVEMAGGAFLVNHTDLALGGEGPLGLRLNRSYTSANAFAARKMGNGWDHDYDVFISSTSHGEPGFGMRQPLDAASMIAALYVNFDLLNNFDDAKTWVTSAVVSKWAVDQVINNAVVVSIGKKSMEFIMLADGSFASPPGITTKLVKNGDGTFSLLERFGTRTDFNASNQVSRVTDADGNALVFTYNGTTLTTVTDAFGRSLTLTYDNDTKTHVGTGRLIKVSDSTGRFVTYDYNTDGNLTTYTDPEEKSWSFGYDRFHRLTTLTNPLGITTATNYYDSFGRVASQQVPRQGPEGTSGWYTFYFSGARNVEQDPSGNNTVYYYDQKGREYAIEDALGNRTTKQFDGQNHIIKVTDALSHSTSLQYDGNQNLTGILDPFLKLTTNTYDTQFNLVQTTDPLNVSQNYGFDAQHHLTSWWNALSNGSATYGAKGLRSTLTDGQSTQTIFTYDSNGSPETTRTGNHPPITYIYDPVGRMIKLTDQVGSYTTFTYDKRGFATSKVDPLRKTTSFVYDDAGLLTSKTDRNGASIGYTYTPSGKIWQVLYPGSASITFNYNLLDQLTSMVDGVGTTSYTYDAAGKVSSLTNPYNLSVSYIYDAAGNVTDLTYPGGKTVIYTYDAKNRVKTVTNWLSQTATYGYDDAGKLTNIVGFNGATTYYYYDAANRLTGISSPVVNYSFDLDGNGNRISVFQTEPLPTVLSSVAPYNYSFNSAGNRLSSNGVTNFTYDNEGQLATGYGGSYVFDYEHRLVSMPGASFSYDGAGNRLQGTRSGTVIRYLYDANGNLLAETDGSNNITRYYIYGAGLLAMVTPQGQTFNYNYNAVGSTVAITDQNQALVNQYSYDTYGAVTSQQETVPQPFKYVGQFGIMNEPNGFFYMRARYYDANVGRFISEDPTGFDGGDVNLMAYVGNNPIMGVDPMGLWTLQIGLAGTGGAGAGGTYERGFGISHSSQNGWQYGFYDTRGGGGFGGIGASGTLNITASGNDSINDLRGLGGSAGGSVTIPTPTIVQPTIGASININNDARPSYTLSIGGATPQYTPIEEHGFVTSTNISK